MKSNVIFIAILASLLCISIWGIPDLVLSQEEPSQFNVLTYNTHLWGDHLACTFEPINCYQDETRGPIILENVVSSEAQIVALQEIWANESLNIQNTIVNDMRTEGYYSNGYFYDSNCSAVFDLLMAGNGLIYLSKFDSSNYEFTKFPTFTAGFGGDFQANKGVLTSDVDVSLPHSATGGEIRVGISHALTGGDDFYSMWDHHYNPYAITTFELNGIPYIFSLREDIGLMEFRQIEDYSYCNDDDDNGVIDIIGDQSECHSGVGWKLMGGRGWSLNYKTVQSFEVNGNPYLFSLKRSFNEYYISRINADPDTGELDEDNPFTHYGPYRWDTSDGWRNYEPENIIYFELKGIPYIFSLKKTPDQAYYSRINLDPVTGELNSDEPLSTVAQESWAEWPSRGFKSFELNGHTYLMELKDMTGTADDHVLFIKINIDPRTGDVDSDNPSTNAAAVDWDTDSYTASKVTIFYLNGMPHIFSLKEDYGEWYISRINADPITGELDASNPLTDFGFSGARGSFIKAINSFWLNGHPYIFMLNNYDHFIGDHPAPIDMCAREAPNYSYFLKISDNFGEYPEMVRQMEDIKIIRDKTVSENGPPGIMMGDFNVHLKNYGFMNNIFGKAGAVDAYCKVNKEHCELESRRICNWQDNECHWEDEWFWKGGITTDFAENRLWQENFCLDKLEIPGPPYDECDPNNPRVYPFYKNYDRLDYVYVKECGDGIRIKPTAATVIADWEYDHDLDGIADMDLSDHFPLHVTFEMEEFSGETDVAISNDIEYDPSSGILENTITVSNNGLEDVPCVGVRAMFDDSDLRCTWACAADGDSSCGIPFGMGDIYDTVEIAANDNITYNVTCEVVNPFMDSCTASMARVIVPEGIEDLQLANNSDSVIFDINADWTPPVLTLPENITAEATGPDGATVAFSATATDIVDGTVPVACDPASGSTFPLGNTTVSCTASDSSGNTSTGTFNVSIVDTTPPEITELSVSPAVIWPPNKKMRPATVSVSATDVCDPDPVCSIVSVENDEGTSCWEITGDLTLKVKAQRRGKGDGRAFTVTVKCVDFSGNASTASTNIEVPHDMRKGKK
jgi:hypothetical protein